MIETERPHPRPFPTASPLPSWNPWRQRLLDAADLLEEKGWMQHAYSDHDGRHCLVGALISVTGPLEAMDLADRLFPGRSATEWNDAPGRTVEEVIALLRGAAR